MPARWCVGVCGSGAAWSRNGAGTRVLWGARVHAVPAAASWPPGWKHTPRRSRLRAGTSRSRILVNRLLSACSSAGQHAGRLPEQARAAAAHRSRAPGRAQPAAAGRQLGAGQQSWAPPARQAHGAPGCCCCRPHLVAVCNEQGALPGAVVVQHVHHLRSAAAPGIGCSPGCRKVGQQHEGCSSNRQEGPVRHARQLPARL